jgi:membrane-associated protease RseP (regulator of RpoE activity)
MSFNFVLFMAIAVVGALALAGLVRLMISVFRGREHPAPAAPPMPASLSFLAGFSFFSGLAALALVMTTGILSAALSMDDVLQVGSHARQGITLAARIVLYLSLLPGVMAVAFALAARGVISESAGAVRGRPLYRTGVLLAILSGAAVLDARVLDPTTWASVGRDVVHRIHSVDDREINRGYLGIELEAPASTRVARVVPGSPAELAGIRVGDAIFSLAGIRTLDGRVLVEQIGSLQPGSRVSLVVLRGSDHVSLTAELAASFATLQSLLGKQDFDDERLAVLKAAGLAHRYSADELTKICETFEFDDGRLKAIERSLPHLQDPQNAYRILGALEFSEAKSKVSAWITERAKAPKAPKAPKEE